MSQRLLLGDDHVVPGRPLVLLLLNTLYVGLEVPNILRGHETVPDDLIE